MPRHIAAPIALGVLLLQLSTARAAATVTFTADDSGTFPRTLREEQGGSVVVIDVSGLPSGATIFRAELVLNVPDRGRLRPFEPTTVHPVGRPEERLRFVPPRNVGLDCLDLVRAAVRKGAPIELKRITTAAGIRRLEVSCLEGSPGTRDLPVVSGVRATHRSGQTFITFTEPELKPWPRFESGADVAAFRREYAPPGLRFRIWRSTGPITPRSVAGAELVGECGFFTAWNDGYHQGDTNKRPPLRYRVTDGGSPVEWGTGIYAHHPPVAGKAHYAVTVALDGEEDFDRLGQGNTTATPGEETVGPGEPVLQWIETPDPERGWHYRRGRIARLVYTRWESPPRASTPSVPIDYLVAIPLDTRQDGVHREPQYRAWRTEPAPVGLHLHCWGGSCNGGYGWWYNAHRGAVLIASNQVPYDWWTGYHEAVGSARTWGDGHVQPFTMNRLFDFLDWAAGQHRSAPPAVRAYWPRLDRTRVFTAGNSMGGSGAPMFAIRHGDRVAWAIGWVGVHVPELSPRFASSYRNSYGPRHEAITMPDGETSPWDHYSDVWWMRQHVAADTGLVIASNGKNDGGIGWPQAVLFARALQETRRPHIFNWAMGGHGTRTVIGSNFDLDLRTNQTLPAFTNCSLDDDPGDGTPDSGDDRGQLNAHLRWRTDEIVDEPGAWAMTVLLKDDAPKDTCAADMTPRRCQRFRPEPGDPFTWTNTRADGRPVARGRVTADRWGLVTLPQVEISTGGNRLRIQRDAPLPAFPGAEGFGAAATGGRGGRVIRVTKLAATGPGSLQAACDATGPRIVVFEVSGVIRGDVTIRQPRITIAGQTAPGAGITIEGMLRSRSPRGGKLDDVVVRHLRVRPRRADRKWAGGDCLQLIGIDRLMVDHVSCSWGNDENVDVCNSSNLTIQWCAIEESDTEGHTKGQHNFGMIMGYDGKNATIHHNLFAHHMRRAPLCGLEVLDHRNNVIYNMRRGVYWHPVEMNRQRPGQPFRANLVGNYFKAGPDATKTGRDRRHAAIGGWGTETARLFLEGNSFSWHDGVIDPWQEPFDQGVLEKPQLRADEPWPAPTVTTHSAEEAYWLVLAQAGCLPRDVVSRRTVEEVRRGAGFWGRHDPSGGLLEGLTAGKAPLDTDHDGLPDDWEERQGLDPRDPADAIEIVGKGRSPGDRHEGYTYIEFYINELSDRLVARAIEATTRDAGRR